MRHIGNRAARFIGAWGGTGEINLDIQVGNMLFGNWDLQGVAAVLNRKAFGVKQPTATDGEQPFGWAKGRLHQYLGDITGLIGFLVGDQHDFFLLHIARGWPFAAGHPDRQFAFIEPLAIIADAGCHFIGAALVGAEFTAEGFER